MHELLFVLVGACASFAGAFALAKLDRRQRVCALRWALGAEIITLIGMIRANDYVQQTRAIADLWQQGDQESGFSPPVILTDQRYLSVFEGNASLVGSLEPRLAMQVVLFYQAVRSSMDAYSPVGFDYLRAYPKPVAIALLRERAAVLENLITLGSILSIEVGGKRMEKAIEEIGAQHDSLLTPIPGGA